MERRGCREREREREREKRRLAGDKSYANLWLIPFVSCLCEERDLLLLLLLLRDDLLHDDGTDGESPPSPLWTNCRVTYPPHRLRSKKRPRDIPPSRIGRQHYISSCMHNKHMQHNSKLQRFLKERTETVFSLSLRLLLLYDTRDAMTAVVGNICIFLILTAKGNHHVRDSTTAAALLWVTTKQK